MSQENVEVFGRLLDAFNARDLDGFLDECDPKIELGDPIGRSRK
jgi:hypothetical protein